MNRTTSRPLTDPQSPPRLDPSQIKLSAYGCKMASHDSRSGALTRRWVWTSSAAGSVGGRYHGPRPGQPRRPIGQSCKNSPAVRDAILLRESVDTLCPLTFGNRSKRVSRCEQWSLAHLIGAMFQNISSELWGVHYIGRAGGARTWKKGEMRIFRCKDSFVCMACSLAASVPRRSV
jgi:hypothetical protein